MSKPKTYAGLVREIKAAKKRIAKERDTLRDLLNDAEEIVTDCDEAIASLDDAADTLSRQV